MKMKIGMLEKNTVIEKMEEGGIHYLSYTFTRCGWSKQTCDIYGNCNEIETVDAKKSQNVCEFVVKWYYVYITNGITMHCISSDWTTFLLHVVLSNELGYFSLI